MGNVLVNELLDMGSTYAKTTAVDSVIGASTSYLNKAGINISRASPDAVKSLDASRTSGTPSPVIPSVHNMGSDAVEWARARWMWIAGAAVAALGVWWFVKRKR